LVAGDALKRTSSSMSSFCHLCQMSLISFSPKRDIAEPSMLSPR
jgi:hypothetical protein